jgi:hypothetical protein
LDNEKALRLRGLFVSIPSYARNEKTLSKHYRVEGVNTQSLLPKSTEAADRLCINRTILHSMVKSRKLECVRFAANSIYFTEQQLNEFIERHRKQYQPRKMA